MEPLHCEPKSTFPLSCCSSQVSITAITAWHTTHRKLAVKPRHMYLEQSNSDALVKVESHWVLTLCLPSQSKGDQDPGSVQFLATPKRSWALVFSNPYPALSTSTLSTLFKATFQQCTFVSPMLEWSPGAKQALYHRAALIPNELFLMGSCHHPTNPVWENESGL